MRLLDFLAMNIPARARAEVSIHADHLFVNGFPGVGTGGATRLYQWLADCDLDLDGQGHGPKAGKDRPRRSGRVRPALQTGGSPLDSMLTYGPAQLKTQEHFRDEGERAIDGIDHED